MFNSAMREGSRNEKVQVQEATHAAFHCMLQYIYGGSVNVPEELAVELLGLADRCLPLEPTSWHRPCMMYVVRCTHSMLCDCTLIEL